MKNTLIIIVTVLIFLLIYFLQVNFFNWFNIAGIKPNLFVILILFLGLFAGKRLAIPMGVFLGICLDFFINKKIGTSGIMLGVIGALGGVFDKNFSKDSRITIILMTIGATAIYEIGIYILNILILSMTPEIIPFIKILSIEILYNILLIIILYPILQKAGYYIEDAFRGNRILTKYF